MPSKKFEITFQQRLIDVRKRENKIPLSLTYEHTKTLIHEIYADPLHVMSVCMPQARPQVPSSIVPYYVQ
jgi:hypothetical protein